MNEMVSALENNCQSNLHRFLSKIGCQKQVKKTFSTDSSWDIKIKLITCFVCLLLKLKENYFGTLFIRKSKNAVYQICFRLYISICNCSWFICWIIYLIYIRGVFFLILSQHLFISITSRGQNNHLTSSFRLFSFKEFFFLQRI